jgi:hypothetical protein
VLGESPAYGFVCKQALQDMHLHCVYSHSSKRLRLAVVVQCVSKTLRTISAPAAYLGTPLLHATILEHGACSSLWVCQTERCFSKLWVAE